jgi:transcriptional antiterminator RfaH
MHWYLVHTKPIQEKCALDNLQRQGFKCYLPTPRPRNSSRAC